MAVLGGTNVSALMSEYFVDQRHALRSETESRSQAVAPKVTTFLGTPETATAALGTAYGVRLRRAEAWAAGRQKGKEEGCSKRRRRGRGAQLRRQLGKKQATMDEWRRQQTAVQPGSTRAESQRIGCTRLLQQLTKAKARRQTAEEALRKTELQLLRVSEECGTFKEWWSRKEEVDLREVQHLLYVERMKVKTRDRSIVEIGAELRRENERLDDFKEQSERWQRDRAGLEEALKVAKAMAEWEAGEGGTVPTTAEAGPGTTRKLAVGRPASTGSPKRLRVDEAQDTLTDGGFDEWLAAQEARG
jgi:hypothetical protein